MSSSSSSSKSLSFPALPKSTPIEICRIMVPDDTNPAGNVHGGTILKLLEQAGHVVGNRHCNRNKDDPDGPPITTALVRLEKMDFHQPMHVGEVAQVQAAVTFTSSHSLEVTVDVWAENVLTGDRRHTNAATLWYVPLVSDGKMSYGQESLEKLVMTVPPLEGLSEAQLKEGQKRYDIQKESRLGNKGEDMNGGVVPAHVYYYPKEVGIGTVLASQTTLANVVLPSDCTVTGHMTGGALMKMMDNAAGICATRHCRSRTVTACIDVINFHCAITNGEIVFVTARLVFASSKSLEVEVTAEAEGMVGRRITNTAYFTFVSLGKDCRAQNVPPLVCKGDEELTRFEEGRKRYLARRKAREEQYKLLMQKQSNE